MCIKISSNKQGKDNTFVSFERTHIIQITHITILYNRLSILTNDSLKSKGRIRVLLSLEVKFCSIFYYILIMTDTVIHQLIGH